MVKAYGSEKFLPITLNEETESDSLNSFSFRF